MTAAERDALASRVKVLTDPTRLEILAMLRAKRDGLTVKAIGEELGRLSQPTISHHLRDLRLAGLVTSEKSGVWITYRLDRPGGKVLAAQLRDLAEALS